MDAGFVRERITQLRLQRGVSEYKMSYELGHSRGYVNNISSGKTLPSMTEFFAICEYFGITPVEFFSVGEKNSEDKHRTLTALTELGESDQKLLLVLADRLRKK